MDHKTDKPIDFKVVMSIALTLILSTGVGAVTIYYTRSHLGLWIPIAGLVAATVLHRPRWKEYTFGPALVPYALLTVWVFIYISNLRTFEPVWVFISALAIMVGADLFKSLMGIGTPKKSS